VWPDWCIDAETKQKYIDDYKISEGIDLDPTQIELNPGLRYIAKFCLNTTWGYLCKNSNKSQTRIGNDPKDLFDSLVNPNYDVKTIRLLEKSQYS
jgi:hypothetical protein